MALTKLTKIADKIAFKRRRRKIERYATQSTELQQAQLGWLLKKGLCTKYAAENGYDQQIEVLSQQYQQRGFNESQSLIKAFQQAVPVRVYDQIKPYIERMLKGEMDVLWPGRCMWWAKSSGTTSDKSKYIPVTKDALKRTHMRGGTDVVAIYLGLNPESQVINGHGKGLILGGSFSNEHLPYGMHVGDLSATLIQNVAPVVNAIRTPAKEIALMPEWETKLQALVQSTIPVNVTSISGVPSWMMGVLKEVLRQTGKQNICEVWPNLEVFYHGGIAFAPYREQYKQLIPNPKMHYLDTYNASEGFFGIQSSFSDPALQLIVDNCIFYEFIPMSQFDESDPDLGSKAIALSDVQLNENYAMVITTPGLWRYIIGDTVKFTQRNPYKFVITGRTKAFINAFGEELMVSNADEAIALTCAETGCEIADYTAAPTFAQGNSKAHHTWVIEFTKAPAHLAEFAARLDKHLQEVNSDYEAKRYKGIFLEQLELISVPAGTFSQWLKQKKGKLGGQIKIPRLSNSRSYIEELVIIADKVQ